MPTFNAPRRVEIILHDDAGGKRIAVALRAQGRSSNLPHWDLALTHDPSGRTWPASFDGNAILDALSELVERKDGEYHTRSGHAKQDRVTSVRDDGTFSRADITTSRQASFGRAAAAAARARSGGNDG